MKKVNRRAFFSTSFGAAAAASLAGPVLAHSKTHLVPPHESAPEPDIIDTNVHIFDWPFRKLKYGATNALVEKLRKHRITQAWAGSYEALFHKDINGVNARLASECKKNGAGVLLPFGTVNLSWPDWEEDLRRCHEVHQMPGIRIYPIYQAFDLDHPAIAKLVEQVAARKMILQIVGDMEDSRHHHPIVEVRNVNMPPLIDVFRQHPDARIQLVYWNHRVPAKLLHSLVSQTGIVFDTSRVEGAGEVGRLIEGNSWYGKGQGIPAERFLFGSHAPYFPVETNVIKLFESPLKREQMIAIMNGNARRFLQSV
jgi:hypothetical protein